MRCPNCGREVEPGTKFCTNCGAAVQEAKQHIEPRKVAVRQKRGGMSPAIIALIIVCVVAVMAAAGFGIGKLISNNSSDTTAETSESQSSDSDFKDYSDSENESEETEEVEFEGVDKGNTADYNNVLKASDYVTFEDGEFTFIYPRNFYNSAKSLKDDTGITYIFDADDGSKFVVGKHKVEGDGKRATIDSKSGYASLLDNPQSILPYSKKENESIDNVISGEKENKGSFYGIVSGGLAEDDTYHGYKSVTYDGGMIYEIEIVTPFHELETVLKDDGDDMQVGNGDYLINTLYFGMSKTYGAMTGGKVKKDKETFVNNQK